MNSFILMATVVRPPELRYSQDNQLPIANMTVEFEGNVKAEERQPQLRIVGMGNLAKEMDENKYAEGTRLIIEGRLSMTTIERPEGYKEKRAELIASRIHAVEGNIVSLPTSSKTNATNNSDRSTKKPLAQPKEEDSFERTEVATTRTTKQPVSTGVDEDNIPF
jgi:single-strand DNA-binding protein